MRGGILKKITGEIETKSGERHGIPVPELRNLQIELDNPIAVFDSKTQKNSLVVLTRIVDAQNNERAVVALHLDKAASGSHTVNDIASMYGKDRKSIENWTAWNLLRYINKQARKESARWLQLPGDSTLRARSVLTEKDFSGEELGRIVPQEGGSAQEGLMLQSKRQELPTVDGEDVAAWLLNGRLRLADDAKYGAAAAERSPEWAAKSSRVVTPSGDTRIIQPMSFTMSMLVDLYQSLRSNPALPKVLQKLNRENKSYLARITKGSVF
jgi:hypothetical protein